MAASKFRIASSSFTSDASFSGSVVFNQDVTVSGTLNVYELKTTLVSSSIIFKSGSTKFGDTLDDLHQFTGSAEFSSGLSGSLTRLVDGTDYLVAGANISITTQSNGSLVITSSGGGGGGTPGGSNTQVQFNNGGSFEGSSNFTFNSSTNSLSVTNLSGSLTELADRSPYLISSGAIKLSTGSSGQVTIGMNITDLTTDVNEGNLDDNIIIADDSDAGKHKKLTLSKLQALVNTNTTYTAGTGLNLVGTEFSVDSDGAALTTNNSDIDHILINDGGVFKRITPGNISISSLNNDSGFTTNTGDIEGVTAGTGLSGGGSTGTVTLNIDLSELTDMTQAVNSSEDELIILDNGADRRKLISEIPLSAFNNDSGFTANTGDITGVTAGTGLSGGGSSGGVTINIDNSVVATLTGSSFSGPVNFHNNAITGSEILDTSDNKLISLNNAVVFNDDSGDHDFRIESNDNQGMFLVDAGTNQILLNNHPSTTRAVHEFLNDQARGGLGNDTGIYLSGSRDAIGTSTKGVTTIVGDLVVSGNIFQDDLGFTNNIYLETNLISTYVIYGRDRNSPFNGGRDTNTSITFNSDEINFQAGGIEMLTLDEATADNVIVNTNGVDVNFRVETNNLQAAIYSDGGTDQVVLGGNDTNISNYFLGTDTNILLSGTIGSKGTSTKGTAVASGDFVVSGTFHNPGTIYVSAGRGVAVNNVSTDTDVAVVFERASSGNDGNGSYSTSTGKFTAPHDGFYQVNASVGLFSIDSACGGVKMFLSGSASSMSPKVVILDSFGNAVFPSDTGNAGSGAEPYTLNGSACIKMSKDAFFNVYIHQVGGSAQMDIAANTDPTTGDFDKGTWLTITQIG